MHSEENTPPNDNYTLAFQAGILQLTPVNKKSGGALYVDFNAPEVEYRRNTAGIKQEIAKAVGCKNDFRPSVLDATAGLGNDAFVLACLGCQMTLLENNPTIYAMLQDGLERAKLSSTKAGEIVREKMHLLPIESALNYLRVTHSEFDVIYLDPMFPERQKSAKVKKSMQYFHDIVGFNVEQELALLQLAKENAVKRVVVKRPKLAPYLANEKPSYELKGKTVRYDIYLICSIK